jgi:hypothetical protein
VSAFSVKARGSAFVGCNGAAKLIANGTSETKRCQLLPYETSNLTWRSFVAYIEMRIVSSTGRLN